MRLLSVLILALLLGLLGWLFLRREAPHRPISVRPHEAGCPKQAPIPSRSGPRPPPDQVRWLAIGAVESPEANQVSIEQDLALVAKVLGPAGLVLYGGGAGARDVQVQLGPDEKASDSLLLQVGDLLAPRAGRGSRYQRGSVARAGAATVEEVKQTLQSLLPAGRSPLLLYLGGHGAVEAAEREGSVTLWGGERFGVAELARELDRGQRPLQLVVTTCGAGAFAETIFRAADPKQGLAAGRCGFFATVTDLPASGCDPNPDRRSQEGYALHFFNALRWRDRDGAQLAAKELDLDGDGRISLAEAHARARIQLDSVDVPTSTSERWLRATSPAAGPRSRLPLLEERAVVAALARRTGLPEELAATRAELNSRERVIGKARQRLEQAEVAEDRAARRCSGELLARWPLLDDPWHPEFAELWRCQRGAIEAFLRRSEAYADYREAREDAAQAEQKHWELRRQAAPVERLVRALEIIELAERLRARGGAAWRSYAAIVSCEGTVP